MKQVSIIGFGRFGKTLFRLLKDDFSITLYDKAKIDPSDITKDTTIAKSVDEIYKSEVIFYCVPISVFEEVISSHKGYFQNHHLLIDVLSVKLHPAKIFKKYLTGSTQALLTHPMFGPDSSQDSFANLTMVLDKFMSSDKNYTFWKRYFQDKELDVIEMTALDHDRIAASSQGLTHFVGRLLATYPLKQTPMDSQATKKLLEVIRYTCNDSWQLFEDLQHYNPYTKNMRIRLGDTYDVIYNKLLPKQINPNFLTFGIQGGKGSFNEEAIQYYLKRSGITQFKIVYLYTTENVLKALHKGDIDRGQFAIHNSVGGIVGESIEAMAKFKFKIIEEFAVKISHALMIRKDVNFDEVNTIMSHPQVFAQCKTTLLKKYPFLKQISGEGELIDHAMVAKHLSEGKLPKNIATMGSKVLAKFYDLKIIEDNLQDAKENYTNFLQVARI